MTGRFPPRDRHHRSRHHDTPSPASARGGPLAGSHRLRRHPIRGGTVRLIEGARLSPFMIYCPHRWRRAARGREPATAPVALSQ